MSLFRFASCMGLVLLCLTNNVQADDDSNAEPANFQSGFYAGAAAGWAHISGRRNDSVTDTDTGLPSTRFTEERTMSDESLQAFILIGYLQRLGNILAVAIEPFFGYGPFHHTVSESFITPIEVPIRLSSRLERRWTYGALAKLGAVLGNCVFIYGTAGYEAGYFQHKLVDEEDKATKGSKTIGSFAFGGGIETEIKNVRVGIEFKRNLYSTKSISETDLLDNEINTVKFSPKATTVLLRFVIPIKKAMA